MINHIHIDRKAPKEIKEREREFMAHLYQAPNEAPSTEKVMATVFGNSQRILLIH